MRQLRPLRRWRLHADAKRVLPMDADVSVLIPVRNERDNIAACLRSVAWCDEAVVVDSGSTDGTAELASHLGAKVIQFSYSPGGPKKKNWALANVPFRHEWILIVDADERVTPQLASEIRGALSDPRAEPVGYYINRRFWFLGRWIRHAGYFPSWNLRLLKQGHGRYELIPDYSQETGDNEVHEHILLDGAAGWLKEPMEHYAYPSIQAFVEKHSRYSTWEAEVRRRYLESDEWRGRLPWPLAVRRRLKRAARQLPVPDLFRFLYHYVWKLGFLDGAVGYVFCRLLAEYEFLIWAKEFEARCTHRESG